MFLWRRRPDDAIKKTIEAAVAADKEGKYQEAVELYASGIEKMMAQLAQLPTAEDKTHLRQKINEYMLRAEYLKEWTAEKARKQTQDAAVSSSQEKKTRKASDRQVGKLLVELKTF
ncbi:Spastin and Fidgetin-like protein [Phytophthora palmivora]|uniref:Spastin and Fidgetin-like protein n=1 Tax=Phytophthora palmivora TaxID=4796 RepID=A0A2P4YHJ7_9STRA|nr:Spastin and Fidgetin-like protein [Phytophthora palmivora]